MKMLGIVFFLCNEFYLILCKTFSVVIFSQKY